MAGILQSIMAKLGPKAGAKELAEFLAKKGTKYSTIAKELETIGLPKHEVDLIRSTLQGQEEIAGKTMLKAPKPTGAATGSNVRSSTKITKDASELLTDAKTLVADMRKANRPEAEIEASLRATYPDLEDVTIRNFMGPEIPKVSSAADDLAIATPAPGKTKAQPDYDREARLKELIKQDKYKPVTDADKWDQGKLADDLQRVKEPKAKAPKAESVEATAAPVNQKVDALDSLDNEVAPPPDPFSEVSDEIEVQPKPFNIDEAPEMGATSGVKDDPVEFDMSVGDSTELTPVSPASEAAVNPAKLDLEAPLPPGKDELASVPTSSTTDLPDSEFTDLIPSQQAAPQAKPPVRPMLGAGEPEILGTPPKAKPSAPGDFVDQGPAPGAPGAGISKKGLAAGAGLAGAAALMSGDTNQGASSMSAMPEVKGTQVPGGVTPTGELGQAQAPIKGDAPPVPPGAQEFNSADPSTDPRRRGPATGAAKPAPKSAEAAQSAMNATNKVQEDSAEIEKKVPGWNDALKAALTAQVSGLEKIQAELREAQARAGKDFKDDMFNARMGEALTAFAQAMVKYAAASEGVRKKLDIAPNYKPQPADFTNVFKAIDSDFQQKIAALRESAQTASKGIATANKQLMDTTARADNQQFQQGQADQRWTRDVQLKTQELDALNTRQKTGQEFSKEMQERKYQLEKELAGIKGQGFVNYAQAMKGAAPILGAENTAQKNANDWQEGNRSKLNKILENKSSSQRQRELSALAAQLGVEPVITPGTLWDSMDEEKTSAAIMQSIEKGRSSNPNTPVAAQLRSVMIESLQGPTKEAIAQAPNGKRIKLGGQVWIKQDDKLVPAPQ
jgi:hypothetical protein